MYMVVNQTEIHAAEPLAPSLLAFEVEMVVEKLKRCKLSAVHQI
jgi:hypothetical protein